MRAGHCRTCLLLMLVFACTACASPGFAPRTSRQQPAAASSYQRAQQWSEQFRHLAAANGTPPSLVDVETGMPGSDATGSVPVVRLVVGEDVFFDTARDQPGPAAGPVLAALAEALNASRPAAQLTILGHTDAVGSDAYNMDLSRRRALGVLRALIARNVDPGQLSMIAIGKRQPIATNDTPDGRAQNRRVEFLLSTSLAANIGVVARRPPLNRRAGDDGPAEQGDVEVLRPGRAGDGDALVQVGVVALPSPAANPPVVAANPPPSALSPVVRAAAHPAASPPAVLPAVPSSAPRYQRKPLEPGAQPHELGPAVAY